MGWHLECCILEDNPQFSPWPPNKLSLICINHPKPLFAQIVGWQLGESNPTAIICLKPPRSEAWGPPHLVLILGEGHVRDPWNGYFNACAEDSQATHLFHFEMGGWDLLWKRAGISELAASWVHWLPSHSNDDSSMSSRNYKIIEVLFWN